MRSFDSISNSTDTYLSKPREWISDEPGMLQSMGSQRERCDLVTEKQQTIVKQKCYSVKDRKLFKMIVQFYTT